MLDLARHVAAVLARRQSAVMVTVVNARGDGGGATPGAKLLFASDARTHGTLGSEALDQVARDPSGARNRRKGAAARAVFARWDSGAATQPDLRPVALRAAPAARPPTCDWAPVILLFHCMRSARYWALK